MISLNISFLGAGKVASALAGKLSETGHRIDLIVSPHERNGKLLAENCGAVWSEQPDFPETTQLIITAIPDSLLQSVLKGINCGKETIVVHTAGSFGLEVFPGELLRTGVFYPLQTFSVHRHIDFDGLPFIIEASDEQVNKVLSDLAISIGGKIISVSSQQKIALHTAAVFMCNFSNYMLTAGKEVADRAGLPFGIFFPLIRETMAKAIESGPEHSQTGPAIRNDRITIDRHLELLSSTPELKKLYSEVTASIMNYYKKT
jgi:predicted short-subunit dehydrogenase-like oxidoreductase (DUF2520 family)